MGRSTKKDKHNRRRAHQREQRFNKEVALADATEAALTMSADGKKILSRPRTGKAFDEALVREMEKRGYQRRITWRFVKAFGQKPLKVRFEVWNRMTPDQLDRAKSEQAKKDQMAEVIANVTTPAEPRPLRRGIRRQRTEGEVA